MFVLIILIAGFDLICLLLKNFKGFYAIELIRKGFQIINLFASKINHLLFKYVQLLFRRDIKQMLILFVGLDLYQHFANCYTIEEVFHHLIKMEVKMQHSNKLNFLQIFIMELNIMNFNFLSQYFIIN